MCSKASDEIDRLKEMLNELSQLYWDLVKKIDAKRSELISIEYRLQAMGWPGVTIGAYISAAFFEAFGSRSAREFREYVDALLKRRQELITEIERERAEMTKLADKIYNLRMHLIQLMMQHDSEKGD